MLNSNRGSNYCLREHVIAANSVLNCELSVGGQYPYSKTT